jgi:ceramide glucosyltransferase
MFVETALALWCAVGIAWDGFAYFLVRREASRPPVIWPDAAGAAAQLSVFKPLPPLGPDGWRAVAQGLESFIAQLGADDELLLGIHEADREIVAPFLETMRGRYPHARLKPVFRASSDDVANPKIAWLKILAHQAEGALWLWSDADIIAPPGFLRVARAEFSTAGAAMLTFPYIVRAAPSAPALFDALFVNVEFYPGVLFLRARGPVDFGLGAGMLFRRDDFQHRADWAELGAALADDFVLGQRLGPVQIGTATLVTAVELKTWKEALRHYLRWSKTVAWNRPLGSAARIAILPVFGWLIYTALHPARADAWIGLAAMIQLEVLFAALICRAVGCNWRARDLVSTEIWTLWRLFVWLICLLPGPVTWSGKTWHGPRSAT